MMCWVIWMRRQEVRHGYTNELLGWTRGTHRCFEWRPELAVEGGW